MKNSKEFRFDKARRITKKETDKFRKAIESKLGVKRPVRGRPPKAVDEKFQPVSIRLHPMVLAWIKAEAKRRKVPYQSLINEILMEKVAA